MDQTVRGADGQAGAGKAENRDLSFRATRLDPAHDRRPGSGDGGRLGRAARIPGRRRSEVPGHGRAGDRHRHGARRPPCLGPAFPRQRPVLGRSQGHQGSRPAGVRTELLRHAQTDPDLRRFQGPEDPRVRFSHAYRRNGKNRRDRRTARSDRGVAGTRLGRDRRQPHRHRAAVRVQVLRRREIRHAGGR